MSILPTPIDRLAPGFVIFRVTVTIIVAKFVEGLENGQRAGDRLTTNVDLDRDSLVKMDGEFGRLVGCLQGIWVCEPQCISPCQESRIKLTDSAGPEILRWL